MHMKELICKTDQEHKMDLCSSFQQVLNQFIVFHLTTNRSRQDKQTRMHPQNLAVD